MHDLTGPTALVSGGSKGIGRAAGRALAATGASVALCARDGDALEAAADEIRTETGGEVHTVASDLATAAGVDAAVAAAEERLGRVDVLVNVAGAAPPGRVVDLTDEQWATAIDLKLLGYIRLMRTLVPGMVGRGFGRIVNVAGTAGRQPDGWLLSAGVVNAAVMALTRGVATDVAAHGVTVNAVCPGPTETARWDGLVGAYSRFHGVSEDAARERVLAGIPAGRIATAEEVADAVVFFASPASGHVTGQSLMVDGGQVRAV